MEYEPTSEDVDRLLSAAADLGERLAPNPDIRVHVEGRMVATRRHNAHPRRIGRAQDPRRRRAPGGPLERQV